MPRILRRLDFTTLLALALVLGGLLFLVRGRGGSAVEGCDPATDGLCSAEARTAALARAGAGGATGDAPGPPHLRADVACRGVAYLCAALDSTGEMRIQRWRDFEGVLVVHVPLPDLPDRALAYALRNAATAGIRLWDRHPFPVLVDERGTREAHVEVSWVPTLGGVQIGLAKTMWSPLSGLSVRSLELATVNPRTGRPVDARQLRLTAAHEMGHALGLPHSNDPHDLMYPANTATTLTAQDYRALEALYAFEDGTVIVR